MKNLKITVLRTATKYISKVAENTSNAACHGILYQPKTPKKLQK
ncbi:cyclic lactone autoinducer peptide [Tepidibacter hydrothermalis]|uniref:Cyclic lactone autoinducer peptide n=1 Tax=Tepidibacter hydrothermalis TaxID=3036126 RepID=A0ABY8ED71_9FIRM|nr:cyclic lactone autoinducer peptide [Tepidibacter hydrothermalis]WFD09529.1 cyclic lactone autoinducer peptide [Tepidibacter hydrothermalis]